MLTRLLAWRTRLDHLLRIDDSHRLLLWAVLMGVVGAFATLLFRAGIQLLQWLVPGERYGGPEGMSMVAMAESLYWPWRLALPALGGIIAGLLLSLAKRYAAGRASDYMEVVTMGDGSVPVRESLLRSLSSLFTIASGGSIGREGPMVQMAALGASEVGRRFRVDPARLRLLVACGAAAGITSAYNTPIAGAFFVAEIVLGSVAMSSMAPILVSSVVANILMRELPGYAPPYQMPPFAEIYGVEVLLFSLLGIALGVLAPRFMQVIEQSRLRAGRLPLSPPLRLGLAGLGVGAISLGVPQVWGNGYDVVNALLHQPFAWQAVVLILLAKLLATALTVGSGAVGGVFTPTLFVGATLGWLFGAALHAIWPSATSAPAAYAIVGMAAFLGAATSAPLMAILMIFEMTLSYAVMLPLVLATVIAYVVSRSGVEVAMYSVTVKRLREARAREALRAIRVRELIEPAQTVVRDDADFEALTRLFLAFPIKYVYVVDARGHYLGAIALSDLTAYLLDMPNDAPKPGARALLRPARLSTLTPDMSLATALEHFVAHQGERLPAVEALDRPILLGAVHKTAVLDAYARLDAGQHAGRLGA